MTDSYFPCYPDCIEGPPTCGCAERKIVELEGQLEIAEREVSEAEQDVAHVHARNRKLEEALEVETGAAKLALAAAAQQLESVQRASDNAHHALYGATVRAERLEEQLEAAHERLAWAARLLRYPDGGDEFSMDCREWLHAYYAAERRRSTPVSERCAAGLTYDHHCGGAECDPLIHGQCVTIDVSNQESKP